MRRFTVIMKLLRVGVAHHSLEKLLYFSYILCHYKIIARNYLIWICSIGKKLSIRQFSILSR